MKNSNSNQAFPKYEYIVFCIVLIFGETYLTYNSYAGFWVSLFYNMAELFSGLFLFLFNLMAHGDGYFRIFMILPVIPIFVAGARNFSPPYSTFIRFYFVSNIMASILWLLLGYSYGVMVDLDLAVLATIIPILILHLNIILSKNPIVKGIDNLAIKLPSSSGSSSLGDDLD